MLLAVQGAAGGGCRSRTCAHSGQCPRAHSERGCQSSASRSVRRPGHRPKNPSSPQSSLQEGSSVVTNGGIYGKVKHIDLSTNKVEVEIARGVVIEVDKNYIFADASSQAPNKA